MEVKIEQWRKKPVVVEVILWDGSQEVARLISVWAGQASVKGTELLLPTMEGIMTASLGDYIIRGVKGEVYPCKPDIFKMTYERV